MSDDDITHAFAEASQIAEVAQRKRREAREKYEKAAQEIEYALESVDADEQPRTHAILQNNLYWCREKARQVKVDEEYDTPFDFTDNAVMRDRAEIARLESEAGYLRRRIEEMESDDDVILTRNSFKGRLEQVEAEIEDRRERVEMMEADDGE